MTFNFPMFHLWPIILLLGLASCGPSGPVINEDDDPAFERGRSYLKVGKEEEALDEFLSVTRRMLECPKSHLESGRLLLSLESRKDPVSSIYHFRRFLLLKPESREASKVEQLIVSAEREIIRVLPGKPYEDYLELIALQEENAKLKRQVDDYKARLGAPLEDARQLPRATKPVVVPSQQVPSPQRAQAKTYVVQQGDSLYAISRKLYGDSSHIDRIFQANRDSLPSKNSLKVGQTLRIPPVVSNR
jgi:LysM repeat protein